MRRSDLEIDESVWIEIFLPKSKGILFGTFYRPPSESVSQPDLDYMDRFYNSLDCAAAEGKEIIVNGDFNCDYLPKKPSHETKKLKEIFKSFGLTQLINEPRRTTSTTATLIDLFATTNPRNISRAIVAESCLSDHDMLISVRKINNLKEQPRVIKCRNYAKYDPTIFCSDLKEVPWDTVLSLTNVDEAWSLWKYNFTAECDKHAPLIDKKVRGRNCPWLTLEIKQMMRARDASLKKYRRSKLDTDLAAYRPLRNKVSARLKRAKESYSRSLLEENSGDSESFWKAVKKILPDAKQKSIPTCIKADDKMITDKQSISELFNTFFTSVVNKLFESCRSARPVFNTTTQELFTKKRFEFTAVGKPFVLKQLKCLKLKKATGLDGLPARLLKDSAFVIADCVTHLINLSIKSGVVPSEWKQAKVVPLFKSGNKDDLDNYRPISILPILSKILEKAVFHQLHSYLSENSLLSPYQSGFRAT